MSYDRGDTAQIDLETLNAAKEPADPASLKLLILPPSGKLIERKYPPEGEILKVGVGIYKSLVELKESGEWNYRWETTGTPQIAEIGNLWVRSDPFAADSLLCSPADVERALGGATLPDDQLYSIEVASAWVKEYLGMPELGKSGKVTVSESDVRCDGFVFAPSGVEKVEVVWEADGAAEELPDDAWTYDQDGVRLRPYLLDRGYTEYPYAAPSSTEEGFPWWYVRVDVTSTAPTTVDPRISFGTALAAGAIVTRSPRLTRGLSGENIGDYSYTLASLLHGNSFFEQAMMVLRPLRRRGPAVV